MSSEFGGKKLHTPGSKPRTFRGGFTVIIQSLVVGPIQANCFILGDEKTQEAVVIDPGDEAQRILAGLQKQALTLKYIINTHGHFDHVGANKALKEKTGAPILIHRAEAPLLAQLSASAAVWGMQVEIPRRPTDSWKTATGSLSGRLLWK